MRIFTVASVISSSDHNFTRTEVLDSFSCREAADSYIRESASEFSRTLSEKHTETSGIVVNGDGSVTVRGKNGDEYITKRWWITEREYMEGTVSYE